MQLNSQRILMPYGNKSFPCSKNKWPHKTNADHTDRFHCASVVDVFCAYVYVFSSLSCVCVSCVFSSSGDHVIFVGYTEIHIL